MNDNIYFRGTIKKILLSNNFLTFIFISINSNRLERVRVWQNNGVHFLARVRSSEPHSHSLKYPQIQLVVCVRYTFTRVARQTRVSPTTCAISFLLQFKYHIIVEENFPFGLHER